MTVWFWFDQEIWDSHIRKHQVSEEEVYEVLSTMEQSLRADGGARFTLGQTSRSRWLKVIFRQEVLNPNNILVVTAREAKSKERAEWNRHKK